MGLIPGQRTRPDAAKKKKKKDRVIVESKSQEQTHGLVKKPSEQDKSKEKFKCSQLFYLTGDWDLMHNMSFSPWASQVALVVKNPPDSAGDTRDMASIPESGRFPGEGNGNPLQYSCLENPHGQRSLAGCSP